MRMQHIPEVDQIAKHLLNGERERAAALYIKLGVTDYQEQMDFFEKFLFHMKEIYGKQNKSGKPVRKSKG